MGTEKEDFVSLTQRISRKTGGITSQTFTSAIRGTGQSATKLFLRGKAISTGTGDLINILRDVLLSPRLQNRERFRQIVLEEKAGLEQALIPRGHKYVNLRIRSHLNDSGWAAEQIKGISYLFFIRDLVKAIDENWGEVLGVLKDIHRILVNRKNIILNITTDGMDLPQVEPHIDDLLGALPEAPVFETDWFYVRPEPFEGMTIPSQINFVGKGANLYNLGYRFHGSALAITRYLRNSWLWNRIRVHGGAYGAFCFFDRLSGNFTFVSYRDPNLIKTLETFDQSARFLRTVELGGEELTKAIIGAIGEIDTHMLPDAKGFVSMLRYLTNNTDEARQKMRDEVLGTKKGDFRAFAEVLDQVKEKGIAKVMGAGDAIRQALAQSAKKPTIVKVL
jgi:Zn-dependent M16 (insulinase) family peptidase